MTEPNTIEILTRQDYSNFVRQSLTNYAVTATGLDEAKDSIAETMVWSLAYDIANAATASFFCPDPFQAQEYGLQSAMAQKAFISAISWAHKIRLDTTQDTRSLVAAAVRDILLTADELAKQHIAEPEDRYMLAEHLLTNTKGRTNAE